MAKGENPGDVSLDDYEIPAPPLAYTIMAWRRKMGVGYFEALQMPLSVIFADIEMMDLEAEFMPKSAIMNSEQG